MVCLEVGPIKCPYSMVVSAAFAERDFFDQDFYLGSAAFRTYLHLHFLSANHSFSTAAIQPIGLGAEDARIWAEKCFAHIFPFRIMILAHAVLAHTMLLFRIIIVHNNPPF